MDACSRWELHPPCTALAALLPVDVWNILAVVMSSVHKLFRSKRSNAPGLIEC